MPFAKSAQAMRLLDDPRYVPFATRYAFDLTRFAVEVTGMTPTHQQVELLDSVAPPGSRTTVRSGHGSGKSRSLAVITLWHLLCYPKSNTMITAPKIEQVRNVAWKEMADVLEAIRTKGGSTWIADYVVFESERVYVKGYKQTWFVFAKTAPKGAPENLAGMHRDWYFVIADEASGIPDENYSVMTGALTDARNRMLMLSQPTRPSGFFYDSHNKLSQANGGVWNAIRMDSTDSPLVSSAFIEEKKQEYTEVEYTIKVLGEFPEALDDHLMGRKAAEACFGRKVIQPNESFGIILSCDVGAGEYRDKSIAVVAHVSGYGDFGPDARRVQIVDIPIASNTRNLQDFSGDVFQVAAGLENVTTMVDAGGMGIAVCQAHRWLLQLQFELVGGVTSVVRETPLLWSVQGFFFVWFTPDLRHLTQRLATFQGHAFRPMPLPSDWAFECETCTPWAPQRWHGNSATADHSFCWSDLCGISYFTGTPPRYQGQWLHSGCAGQTPHPTQ